MTTKGMRKLRQAHNIELVMKQLASTYSDPNLTFGAFPVRKDITVINADDPKRMKIGWTILESKAIVVIGRRYWTKKRNRKNKAQG